MNKTNLIKFLKNEGFPEASYIERNEPGDTWKVYQRCKSNGESTTNFLGHVDIPGSQYSIQENIVHLSKVEFELNTSLDLGI